MTSEHHEEHDHMNIPKYIGIFLILIVGTVLTYFAATVDMDHIFPGANTLVALAIARLAKSLQVMKRLRRHQVVSGVSVFIDNRQRLPRTGRNGVALLWRERNLHGSILPCPAKNAPTAPTER